MVFNKKRIFLIFIRIVLFFVFIEMFLFLNGKWTLFEQKLNNVLKINKGDFYKILCVGDSTTVAHGEETIYPNQLEQILNRSDLGKKMKFTVLNKGRAAADSTYIIKNIEQWLNEYDPDMVITMIGALEQYDLEKQEDKSSFEVPEFIEKLRVYKFFKGVLDETFVQKEKRIVIKDQIAAGYELGKVPEEYVKLFYYALSLKNSSEYKKAEKILWELSKIKINNQSFINMAKKELSYCYLKDEGLISFFNVLKYFLDKDINDFYVQDEVRNLCRQKNSKPFIENLLLPYVNKEDNKSVIGLLVHCSSEWKDENQLKNFTDKYNQILSEGINVVLKQNYLNIADMLKKRNIKAVFVQYPLWDVNKLKAIFKGHEDYDEMVFVDNEAVFSEALQLNKYNEYFADRIFSNIGHGTEKGNRVLAENIAKSIYLIFE